MARRREINNSVPELLRKYRPKMIKARARKMPDISQAKISLSMMKVVVGEQHKMILRQRKTKTTAVSTPMIKNVARSEAFL